MLSYDMKLVPLISAKYEKIQAAYELLGAVITNCPQSILPQDEAVLAKALLKARQGAEAAEQNISLCNKISQLYADKNYLDKELYRQMLLNISPNLAGMYKLNLLLFDKLLIGADMIESSYLDDNEEADDDLSEFYADDTADNNFEELLQAGRIASVDDTIVHNGKLYENEFSEQWEEYEYEYDKYRKQK